MSTISQSMLMALTATVNKFTSTNVHAVQRIEASKKSSSSSSSSATSTTAFPIFGRRGILLSAFVAAANPANDAATQLLQKYLKKSEENKTKNDKERLDSYYKRNYKDYFELIEGGVKGKKEQDLSESEKGILDWLQKNK